MSFPPRNILGRLERSQVRKYREGPVGQAGRDVNDVCVCVCVCVYKAQLKEFGLDWAGS